MRGERGRQQGMATLATWLYGAGRSPVIPTAFAKSNPGLAG